VVESAFQRRGHYHQIGWNGFAGYADFKSAGKSIDRWNSFNVPCKPWRRDDRGKCVVIGQLPRDTQVQDVDHMAWCRNTVAHCQRIYRHVSFRPHPRCEDPAMYGIDKKLLDTGKLKNTLNGARCVVTWNSTTGVDAVLAGVPVVAMDEGSISWPMASHTLKEPLRTPDREQWLAGLGYSQWTMREMKKGLPWSHLAG